MHNSHPIRQILVAALSIGFSWQPVDVSAENKTEQFLTFRSVNELCYKLQRAESVRASFKQVNWLYNKLITYSPTKLAFVRLSWVTVSIPLGSDTSDRPPLSLAVPIWSGKLSTDPSLTPDIWTTDVKAGDEIPAAKAQDLLAAECEVLAALSAPSLYDARLRYARLTEQTGYAISGHPCATGL